MKDNVFSNWCDFCVKVGPDKWAPCTLPSGHAGDCHPFNASKFKQVVIPDEYLPPGASGSSFNPDLLRTIAAAHIAHRFDHTMEVKAWVLLYLLDAWEELQDTRAEGP